MLTYAIKRILLMIPTFFAISLLVFVMLNIGAGDPGAQQFSADGNQDAEKGENQESYRIFKEQFGLDKPVLFNTRFGLEQKDLERALTDTINASGNVTLARQIEAQENLNDWGHYAVPGLIDCLQKSQDPLIRAKASQRLAISAQTALFTEYTERELAPEEEKRQKLANREIRKSNTALKAWVYTKQDSAERVAQVNAFWTKWWSEKRSKWS